MPKLPRISGKEAVRIFEKIGYKVVRQKGSHIRMIHYTDRNRTPLTVPDHKELGVGLLRKLVRDSKLTTEEFTELSKE